MLNTLRRISAVFLILILIPVLASMSLLGAFKSTVFEPSFYKEQLVKADIYKFIHDEVIPYEVKTRAWDTISDNLSPLGLSNEDLSKAVKTVLTKDWAQKNTERTIDQVVPYLSGEKGSFTIRVSVKDEAKIGIGIIKDWTQKEEIYRALLENFIMVEVSEKLDDVLLGMGLSEDDPATSVMAQKVNATLQTAIMRVITPEWFGKTVENVIVEVEPYILGDQQRFNAVVPLQDRYLAAFELVFGAEMTKLVAPAIMELPLTWAFTQADLEDLIVDNYGRDGYENFSSGREIVKDGIKFTDSDLKARLIETSSDESLQEFERRRDQFLSISNPLIHYLILAFMVTVVGLLGGRSLSSRLTWASLALVISSFVAFVAITIAAGQIETTVLPNLLDSLSPQTYEAKLNEIISNVIAVFVSESRQCLFVTFGIGTLGFVGALVASRFGHKAEQTQNSSL
ncbi:MAG: hypothetical protein DK304_001289 [Chloroflexi bacterium]|nr:MAG: hypothetical protein DK304_001289 [Chloroflexota bacterium]